MVSVVVVPVVSGRMTAGRARKVVENKDFAAFASRVLRAYGRRVAAGDVEALPDPLAFSREVEDAIIFAVRGLRGFGYHWVEIAQRLGVSKDAVVARWDRAITRGGLSDQDYLPTLSGALNGAMSGGDW
jgi:hypothetical protein